MSELEFEIFPVQLVRVNFPKTHIELDRGATQAPYRFPELSAEIETRLNPDELEALMFLEIKSEQYFEDDTQSDIVESEEPPAVKVDLTVAAVFQCIEIENQDEQFRKDLLLRFVKSGNPASIVWAYVRAHLAHVVSQTGLPTFHIPLVSAPIRRIDVVPRSLNKGNDEDLETGVDETL